MSSASLPPTGRAIVKNVLSGDTVVLRARPQGGPPPEKVLSLANLQAPRLGTARDPEKEEPYAYESREFLRQLLVGKEVAYKVEYTTSTNQRDFGVIVLQHPVDGESNVNRLAIKEGWARARAADGKRTATDEQEQLAILEAEASANQKGIFRDTGAAARTVSYDVKDDARAFLEKHKGKPIPAVLEQVRDGSTFRVLLLLPDGTHQYITLMLSGLKAPTYRKGVPNVQDLVEEYGEEAKYFVESRLLQRDIKVVLEGLSSNDNFVGSVQFPAGNIAEALLAEGLAKVVDWNITLVTGGPQRYRAAEQKAKDKKLRLWKTWAGKPRVAGPEPEFDAVVTRVISADTLIVESAATGKERRIQLASIRAPKGPEKKEQPAARDASIKEYGYDFEAKEFLRSRCIGKPVHVVIDYVKPAEGQYEERECATVTQGSKNLAELLVSRGLADIIRHRKDDDNRSSQYDSLLIALDRAQKAQKGIHSPKDAPLHRISDASATVNKAKQFFPFLQRSGTVAGVVDYVSSGSRFRIYVPTQNCTLTLVLGGIRAPKVGRPGEKSEPFGQEALDFVSKRVMQRDVEFSVEGQDKVGGFIGALYITINDERKNVAAMLLEEGLASVHDYSASQSPNSHVLYSAEKGAREAKKGVWKNYTETEEPVQEQKFDESKPLETKDVIVSNIEGGGRLFLQVKGADLNRLEDLMSRFAQHHQSASTGAHQPRNGEYCSAQFSADDQWYRARVKKTNPDKTYQLIYIDYGNSETVPSTRIRPLDPSFSTTHLAPQAIEARLAYLRVPELDQDYGEEAYEYLRDATENRDLVAKIVGKVPGVSSPQALNVILYDKKSLTSAGGESINERVVRDGFGTVERAIVKRLNAEAKTVDKVAAWSKAQKTAGNKTVVERMVDAQEEAKGARTNMWRYGDFTEDDE
ncbi:uncharacterized protein EV422DRAFT_256727 [Fimicolochytrium jonesii]|uniref:uncharacterized protein n=1 Tax=Fimicolochytrium jonesii TaxID=1396493 RepID=UPI0022FE8C0F|nr:uncharacterized protein EV422DRAFT_256727 [Fimicolochytrium jonesii]KAI8817141.1 hypothetical protein EV422DRAFT_256727 [Fimicolochytrium jonesii]